MDSSDVAGAEAAISASGVDSSPGYSSDEVALLAALSYAGVGSVGGQARASGSGARVEEALVENVGTIKSFDPDKGYGFISCPETWELYNIDVFIHKKQLNGFQVGDMIRFQVRANAKGQPQASDVRGVDGAAHGTPVLAPGASPHLLPAPEAGGVAALSIAAVGDSRREQRSDGLFKGIIKRYDPDRGFGFIDCVAYGQDVFVHQTEINGFRPGDKVQFQVKVKKKGRPQAINLEEEVREIHHGVVKKVDEAKGYGFISCQEVYDFYGADVFVAPQRLEGLSVGDAVSFSVQLDNKGRPQAVDLALSSAEPTGAADGADLEDGGDEGRCLGTIKSYSEDNGYGFISGKDVQERYGRDVFLHNKQIKTFQTGDRVSFLVRIINGRPQAYTLKEAPKTLAWLSMGSPEEEQAAVVSAAPQERAEEQEYTGEIKSYSSFKGYGFIHCAELFERFGRDVFIHSSHFEGFHIGDKVKFRAQVKRGQPQACDVALLEAGSSRASASAASNGVSTAGEARPQEDLDRALLRACASARPESATTMAGLLAARANPNLPDITGQTPIMISALNVRHSEKKCKLLIQHSADLDTPCSGELNAVQWAKERINRKFALFLEATQRGETLDDELLLDAPGDEF